MDEKLLQQLRQLGVKSITFDYFALPTAVPQQRITSVEFFPSIPAIDADSLFPPSDRATEPPPAPADEAPVPVKVAPSMARILKRGSVS